MKKFRLLSVFSSLLVLVCSFTSCSTELSERYPTISLSVVAGEVTSNSAAFTIEAEGADEIYYWVVNAATETEENTQLLIEKGTYLDAQTDLAFKQDVVASGLAAATEYHVYVYAKNFAHFKYSEPLSVTTTEAVVIATPSVEVVVDEAEVYQDSFLAFVTATNAQKAAWLVVPKYSTGVTADKVFAEGVVIEDALVDENGAPAEVAVIVEDLEAATDYDFYVAVDNQGVRVLSAPAAVTTADAAAPEILMDFDELLSSTSLFETAGLPGLWLTLRNTLTGAMGNIIIYDMLDYPNYAGFLSNGDYPALTGSIDAQQVPVETCLLADPSYTGFQDANGEYTIVGNLGVDGDGTVYGVNVLTVMPAQDMNQLSFNVPVVDAEGNQLVIRGTYTGPLGYVANLAAYPMDLNEWGFTKFTKSVEGNVVTLKSTNNNGDFVLNLTTEGGVFLDTPFVAGEGGNMTGGYTSYLEGAPETFAFTGGRIIISQVDENGNYLLEVSTRAGEWTMQGQSGAYSIVAPETGYAITITDAQ